MSVLAPDPSISAVSSFGDDSGEDRLNFIEEKQVMPIIGPELVTVQTEAGTENLHAWIARAPSPCPMRPPAGSNEPGGQP